MEVRFAFLEYSAYIEQDIRRIEKHLSKLPRTLASMLSLPTTKRYVPMLGACHKRGMLSTFRCERVSGKCIAPSYGVHRELGSDKQWTM